MRLVIFLLLVLWASACIRDSTREKFYPIDDIVTAQLQDLVALEAQLEKKATVGRVTDSVVYTPKDTTEWAKELDIFRQLKQLNKPVNHGSYTVEDGLPDSSSNLTVKQFSTTEQLPVRYLRVYYQDSAEKPKKIEALYNEKNSLYSNSRILSLNFRNINNKNILTSYSINGGQKMILGDSVTFNIDGKITIK